jgi:hypothetical protein
MRVNHSNPGYTLIELTPEDLHTLMLGGMVQGNATYVKFVFAHIEKEDKPQGHLVYDPDIGFVYDPLAEGSDFV